MKPRTVAGICLAITAAYIHVGLSRLADRILGTDEYPPGYDRRDFFR